MGHPDEASTHAAAGWLVRCTRLARREWLREAAAVPPQFAAPHTGGYGPHPGGYGAPMGGIPQAAPAAPRRAVTYTPRDTNHLLHLVLTILTCGLWGFVWILMVVLNAMSKKKSVTHYR